jgi:hypothetical protein
VSSAIIGPRTLDQLEEAIAGADAKLDEAALDAIDQLVAPGTSIEESDRGWSPPWMEPRERRIRT